MGMIPNLQKFFSYSNFKVITNKDLTYKYYAVMNRNYPNDYNNFVHCIWYCLTGERFEQVEIDLLNRLRNYRCLA